MKKLVSPGRLIVLAVLLFGLLALYVSTLYKLQIIEGNEYYEASTNSIVSQETVIAARGNILDRYGRLLVSNRNCNNLLIDTDELFEQDDPNAVLLKMCAIVTENGDTYTDELPITTTTPFEFVDNMTELQRTRLDAWLTANGLDSDASAVEVMAKMRSRYDIDNNYTAEEARIIAGVRYEINVRYVINTSDYVYAEDVSIDTITALMEADVPGFEVQVSYIREYNTEYAAHILGYTGLMDESEIETYQEKGYKLNATVGKSGAEKAFEEYLHGTDGTAAVTRTSDGIVTSTVYTEAPEPGNHVYLTIDIELQGVAEQALASFIKTENETREADNAVAEAKGEDTEALITGGALVAIDVNTGEPLVIASYPTYSLDTYWDDYADLVADTVYSPLLNRALQGEYAPGSTFKPVTALAALCENFIGAESTFVCTGVYEKYASLGYSPRCTGTHGTLTVTDAITASCNLFFYQVGDLIGIEAIDEYATTLGLGQSTGIELYEEEGRVASPETKAQAYANSAVDQEWYAADTLQAAIGQSITGVTPIQLARYCAALANSGTVYNCSLVKSISSYDYSESIFERTPSVFNTLDANDYVWDLIHTGMWGVANSPYGTAYSILGGYEPQVAAKTGTTETGAQTEDAVFICYAPADDPEIAIAVVVEKGKRGAKLADIAKTVLDYYFDFEMSTQQVESELTLLH
jgi:penicillin-binding protein 2